MTNNQLTAEQIENIIEMAGDAAKRYGPSWDSALVAGPDGNFHAITSDTLQAVVVQVNDDSRDSSWLCDYLESVSPAIVLAALRELQERHMADVEPVGYFAFDNDGGFTNHDTAERAQKEAHDAIEYFRETADEGWSDETDSVCWGVILQEAKQTDARPVEADDKCAKHVEYVCDYVLSPDLPEQFKLGKSGS